MERNSDKYVIVECDAKKGSRATLLRNDGTILNEATNKIIFGEQARVKRTAGKIYHVGDRIGDERILRFEPAVYMADGGQMDRLYLALSKVYFESNPDSPVALGTFRNFEKVELKRTKGEVHLIMHD